MAPSPSSSGSSSLLSKKYDVFISFRGADTRSNFTSHLHDALRRNEIETYIDYRIEKGDEAWPALEKAIEDSTLFLVIFSHDYASSTWCLKELSKILEWTSKDEEKKLVMPVFCKIDPSDLTKKSGSYQEAFAKHEHDNIDKQQLEEWRKDLTHASQLEGWNSSKFRDENKLIRKIVKKVIAKLRHMFPRGNDLENYVGIRQKMRSIKSLLNKGSPHGTRFVGIWGTGGIGKTTLARVVFHKLRPKYEGSCFLMDVREESQKYGIAAVKKKLVSTLLGDEFHFGMYYEIHPYDMKRLSRKRSLIVLDDVDDPKQLENLAGKQDWFGSGSKILITTRNKQVLNRQVDDADIYEVQTLNRDEAFHLFCKNAFKNGSADQKLGELGQNAIQNVISYANGIPLALEILGRSFLRCKSHQEWESQVNELKKTPDSKIHRVLKWSYDGLSHKEKNIFLDVACIFKGCYVMDIKNILDARGYSTLIGLRNLKDKALLYINGGKISMHDLIEEMGREIIRKRSLKYHEKRSRLWNSNDIFQILKDIKGAKAVEAISLNLSEITEGINLSPQAFCSMPNLEILRFQRNFNDQVNKLHFPDGVEFPPNKLILLHWEGCSLKSLPSTFKPENLVTIEMPNSNLTKLWDGVQNLVNLRKINFHQSENLIELPDFSKAIHLEHVILTSCLKLESVHPSILSLHSITYLQLRGCKALTSLTSNTHLKSLNFLDVSRCSSLRNLSVTSENCQFSLDASETAFDGELSSSSGCLSKINAIYLNNCESVTNLPDKLVDLSNLRRLHIRDCKKLALNLRLIFDRLHRLEVLWLDGCCDLVELPDNINSLSSLYELSLERSNVETLPVSIKHLSNLQRLRLTGCKRLRYLPELPPTILLLEARDCTSLESVHVTSTTAVIEEEEEEEEEEGEEEELEEVGEEGEGEEEEEEMDEEEEEEEEEVDEEEEEEEEEVDEEEEEEEEEEEVVVDEEEEEEEEEDEVFGEVIPKFDFGNCMKLDEQLIKAVEAKILLEMNKGVSKVGLFIYPGNRVPDWFMYRSTQPSITVNLSSILQPWDWSFVFCVVVSNAPSFSAIFLEWFINGQFVDYYTNSIWIDDNFRDHVFLKYISYLPPKVRSIIKNKERDDQSSTHDLLVEIKFEVSMDTVDEESFAEDETIGMIKECGICPTSAPECRSFIKQMELALQPHPQPGFIGTDVRSSNRNTHHKEAVSRKRKHLDEMI